MTDSSDEIPTSAEKRALLERLLKSRATAREDETTSTIAGPLPKLDQPDLEADVHLDDSVATAGRQVEFVENPKAVLLTGAAGFLGGYLLRELLLQTSARVYCLIRKANFEAGHAVIRESLEALGVSDTAKNRIVPISGDISADRLGLGSAEFELCAGECDAIYHNAAVTSFAYSYPVLRGPNVNGPREILKLATHGRLQPVHYVSSLSVFESILFSRSVIHETDMPCDGAGQSLGYTQSKWVAEKLMLLARQRGVPVSVYRPTIISGDSKTGRFNKRDLVWQFIKLCIELGSAPDVPAVELNMCPVDYVASAIVGLSKQCDSMGKTFHLSHPGSVPTANGFWQWLDSIGIHVKPVPMDQWLARFGDLNQRSKTQFSQMVDTLAERLQPMVELASQTDRMAQFDCRNTLEGLKQTSIACPSFDQLMATYLAFFVQSEFFANT